MGNPQNRCRFIVGQIRGWNSRKKLGSRRVLGHRTLGVAALSSLDGYHRTEKVHRLAYAKRIPSHPKPWRISKPGGRTIEIFAEICPSCLKSNPNKTSTATRCCHEVIAENPDAPWLVFVHGAGGSIRTWKFQIDAFAPHFRLLLIDLRDHGYSKDILPEFPAYDFDIVAKDILVLTDHLGIERRIS